MALKVLDLFSGIGGFSLGLERTGGFRTVAFCEIEPYCQRVLAKHWPGVPIYEDVREIVADTRGGRCRRAQARKSEQPGRAKTVSPSAWCTDGTTRVGPVDVITAGFPCQDISFAGNGAGIDGERSGLWSEVARLCGELRPRYVILENVAALLGRGLGRVLGDLAEVGYDTEWHCIPAAHIGAPHRRDRWWGIGYPNCQGEPTGALDAETSELPGDVADAISERQPRLRLPFYACYQAARGEGQTTDAVNGGLGGIWATEPDVGRVAHGVPRRVDRLKGLGNAVVPQIPELIGRAILATL